MARRVLDFATNQSITDAGYTTAVSRLKDEVAKADELGRLQGEGSEREHAAVAARNQLRQNIRSQQLKRRAQLAQLNASAHPELAGRYRLPASNGPNRTFILQAQSMLANATDQKDLLAQLGVGDTFIADLTTALATFDQATATAHASRADHVGARTELSALARRCEQEVEVIGTFIEATSANDEQVIGAWRSARNVAGPFTRSRHNEPPVPAPTPNPEPAPLPVTAQAKAA